MIPSYLAPATVPGLARCYFEFRSQDVLSSVNRYRGKKRYRFNKFYPISERFPEVTYDGLSFDVSQNTYQGIIGMLTPWSLPIGGEVIFRFSSSNVAVHKEGGFAEVGVGFLQHNAPWWWIVDGMSFSCRRKIAAAPGLSYTTLSSQHIFGADGDCGIGSSFLFHLKRTATGMTILFTEFAANGETVVASSSHTIPIADQTNLQPVMLYCRAVDATGKFILARTDVINCSSVMPTVERVYFHENPDEYLPPIGTLQAPPLDIYSQPHFALIEDATIEMSTPLTPITWFNLLCYLVDSTAEPMIFSDIEGRQWLTCFSEVSGKGKKARGGTVTGYTLTLQVLVVH